MEPLPHNLDYEQSILAAILIDPDLCRQAIETLKPEHFADCEQTTKHSLIFQAASELFKNGEPVELPTIAKRLQDKEQLERVGAKYLAELTYHPIAGNIQHYANEIRFKHSLRKTIEITNQIQNACFSSNGDAASVLADAKREILDINLDGLNQSRFAFLHNADAMANLKPIEWRIQDILVENSLYYDFGDPGSFKTFIALDRLLCTAAGIDYHGHRVKQGTVFYIAGEGQQGIGRRILSWHIEHKTNPKEIPFFLAKTPTQLMDPGAVDEVRRAVDALSKEYGPPAVLHIDTLARNFGEGDENATKDMNRVIQNMDAAFGNDFCRGITHHTGHTNKDRARGSMALHGATDIAFRVSVTDSQQVLVECKKMKDARASLPMLFDLKTILLLIGDQKDQSYVLSLAAEGEEAAAAARDFSDTKKTSAPMQKTLEVLDSMYAEYEKNLNSTGRDAALPRVAVSDWRNACIEKGLYKRKENFNRAMGSLKKRKLIHFDGDSYYVYPKTIYLKYFGKDESIYE
jgi:hypothetical protein